MQTSPPGQAMQKLQQRQQPAATAPEAQPAACPSALTSLEVDKLLALELEVVQLAQSLHIAQLDYQARGVQLQALTQRVYEAEGRAAAAEERAASTAQQLAAAETECGRLHARLAEAGALHRQAAAEAADQLSSVEAKLDSAQVECGRLRKQAERARRLEAEVAQQQSALNLAAAQARELRERLARTRQENQQLRAQIGAASGRLKAMGIPAHEVLSRAALALAAPTAESLPGSPGRMPAAPMAVTIAVPHVPRLQLSAITLQQLRERASVELTVSGSNEPGQQQQPYAVVPGAVEATTAVPDATAAGLVPPEEEETPGSPTSEPGFAHVVSTDETCALQPLQLMGEPLLPGAGASRRPPPIALPGSLLFHSLSSEQWHTARGMRQPVDSPALHGASIATSSGGGWMSAASGGCENAAMQPEQQQQQRPHPFQLHNKHQQHDKHAASECPPPSAQLNTARSQAGSGRPPLTVRSGSVRTGLRYGQLPTFQEIRAAYMAVVTSAAGTSADRTSRWVSTLLDGRSAVDTDPRRVEPVMLGLVQLFQEAGLPLPLRKVGPCKFALQGRCGGPGGGGTHLVVRLVNGRLMTRSGPTNIDVLDWLERQPVPTRGAGSSSAAGV